MRIRFIINPISGTGIQKNIDKLITENFKNENYEIYYTKGPRHATVLSAEAVKLGIDTIVAIGGDGTINICAKNIIHTNIKLGIIPKGSGNGTAYTLGLNKNIKKCLDVIKKNKVNAIDVGIVNDKIFLNNTGFGFDAHVSKKIQKKNKKRL